MFAIHNCTIIEMKYRMCDNVELSCHILELNDRKIKVLNHVIRILNLMNNTQWLW